MAALLTLVRHGETPANLDGVWHGSTDTPLTERGRLQAERVAGHLKDHCADAAALYSSPLLRARDTAEPIGRALGLALRIEPDLREYDLGRWEGRTYRELYERERFFEEIRRNPHFAPHGGESPRQVTDRLAGAMRRIAGIHSNERVVVVVHGGALSMALAELIEGDYTRWQRVMRNCSVSELVLDPRPALLSFDVADHLGDIE